MTDDARTIFALSSGSLPCAIAIIRISGPQAQSVAGLLGFVLPLPRHAARRTLRDREGGVLDRGLVLFFPEPQSATGEDVVELHVHGSRAGVRAILRVLGTSGELRPAQAGEFTRRALLYGKLDLFEAESLGDLLSAETETQRRRALAAPSLLSRTIENFRAEILRLSARVEVAIDHDEELDDRELAAIHDSMRELADAIDTSLDRASATRLRDGFRVVIAGPPNAGKSTLLNRLVGRDVAIISAIPGTTRDILDVGSSLGSVPVRLIDTAGLRSTRDEIEAIGVERATAAVSGADVLLWLGEDMPPQTAGQVIKVAAKADVLPRGRDGLHLSARTGEGLHALEEAIVTALQDRLPREEEALWNDRQRGVLLAISGELRACLEQADFPLVAEHLRMVRLFLDRMVGRAGVEDLLDAIFATFCLGK